MTKKEQREIIRVIGRWEPIGTSVELEPADRKALREQIATLVAPALGVELEAALTWLDVARMT